jgi:para-aminobenzoate synthetase component 1
VQRKIAFFSVDNTETFKQQMLHWANQFSICCFLDNNQYTTSHHSYEWLLAAGATEVFSPSNNILDSLKQFFTKETDWLFGHVSYDLKNEIENLTSSHADNVQFPDIFLYRPEIILFSNHSSVVVSSLEKEPVDIFKAIQEESVYEVWNDVMNIEVVPRISKEDYCCTIELLRQHILRGDCYEINFCMEFFATDATISPLAVYKRLTAISPNPFSCFYKCNDKYLFCASPERYLKKAGNTIVAQPIKGTMPRDKQNKYIDALNKKRLNESSKERSENVMVVDLIRNDLSKVCKNGTVQVEELFGIYSFPQVYQMISTVNGQLEDNIDFADILKATFPMGSMTGAPKKRVMELIEQYEKSRRGIFSGAVGYITPEKDFDFNVVIRSIMYNEPKKYLSYMAGSGITFYSDAEQEYRECLLKAEAMKRALMQ